MPNLIQFIFRNKYRKKQIIETQNVKVLHLSSTSSLINYIVHSFKLSKINCGEK